MALSPLGPGVVREPRVPGWAARRAGAAAPGRSVQV